MIGARLTQVFDLTQPNESKTPDDNETNNPSAFRFEWCAVKKAWKNKKSSVVAPENGYVLTMRTMKVLSVIWTVDDKGRKINRLWLSHRDLIVTQKICHAYLSL